MAQRIFLFLFLLSNIIIHAQTDTLSLSTSNGSTNFFTRHEKIEASAWTKVSLVTRNRRTTTLAKFLQDDQKMYPDHVLADLDGDGKNELITTSYTGGAHCCDEISIFRNSGPNKYVQTARLYGGHSMITSSNELLFTFYEHFGYFFSCYACGISDTSDTAPIDVKTISLVYSHGKLTSKAGDAELRSVINDNLGKLSEMPYEELDTETQMDNGLRKEFAMNLAVYHFAFGKSLAGTKAMFNRYYKFQDASKVWAGFAKQLKQVQADSDL